MKMSREEIFEEVKLELIEALGLDEDINIKEEDKIIEDLEADSLDFVEFIIKMEKKFDIKISDEDIQGKSTVGDIVDYVQSIM